MKKNKIYYINVFTSLLTIITLLYLSEIYPFGNKLLGDSDAFFQFKPMLYDFIMKIKTNSILNYSFSNGLGNPFAFNYLYYLSSPLNLVAILFKQPNSMYLAVVLLKYIIASITMTFYVKKKTDNNYIIFLSTFSYVFCSWSVVFKYFNIWLDIFMIFPLFQYGLEELLNNKKYHLYIFTLSYILISNFFLAFSICIYTLLYFVIYELLYKKDTKKNKIITFDYVALSTIVSFLLSFLFLYILYDCMIKMKIPISQSINTDYNTGFLELIKSINYGILSFTPLDYGNVFPHFAVPTIVFIGSLSFFFNQKISKRDKIYSLLVMLLIISIVCIPKLDSVMNGFHNVRGFPFRYSFIISFLIIKLFINNYNNNDYNKKSYYVISFVLLMVGIVLFYYNKKDYFYLFNVIFLAIWFITIALYDNNRLNKFLILTLFVLQIVLINYKYLNIDFISEDLEQFNYVTENKNYRLNIPEEMEDSIYQSFNYYTNDKTTYFFSSMSYNQLIKSVDKLGVKTYFTSVMIMHDSDELLSLLLNVKNNNNNLYLEKIYSVNGNILNTELNEFDVKFNLEQLIKNMTNIDNIFIKKELKATVKDDKYLFKTSYQHYLIDVLNENGGTNIIAQEYKEFTQDLKNGKDTATIYVLDRKKLTDIYNYLKKNQIHYKFYNDNHMKGKINVDKGQIIFTSIPYDKDWVVKVDGKEIKPIVILDSLMGIPASEGEHEIELEYKTHYLIPALISLITFILLIIDIIRRKEIR